MSQRLLTHLLFERPSAKADNVDQALMDFETNRRDVANAVVKISQKGLFLGPNDVDPLAIRYQNEIEPLTE